MYEWYVEYENSAPETRADWIVRAAQERCVLNDDEAAAKLWPILPQTPTLGLFDVEIKTRPNRAARVAHLTVRSATGP